MPAGHRLPGRGLPEEAAAYREALRLRPDFVEAWNNLGNALVGARQPDEARAAFEQSPIPLLQIHCPPRLPPRAGGPGTVAIADVGWEEGHWKKRNGPPFLLAFQPRRL